MSQFSNNQKVKLIAEKVNDEMPYVKGAESYLSQEQMKGKKYGMSYKVYIADPGRVYDGLEANEDAITEVEYTINLKNKGNSCAVDSWDELVNIEDFKKEILDKRAVKLAKEIQDDVIKNTIYRSNQVVVTTGAADFETLSDGAAKLREVAVAGDAVSFLTPTTMGKIAAGGLAKFLPDDTMKKIYAKNYLGEYAGASQVEVQGLPVITTPSAAATFSVSLGDVVKDSSNHELGFAPVTAGSIANGVAGASIPFSAEGLKVVDVNGKETDQDYIVMADASGKIPELRITVEGQGYGNPNAWVKEGTSALSFSPMLSTSTKYEVGAVRIKNALAFDTYKFNKLAGVETIGTEKADNSPVTIECIKGSNYKTRESLIRMDAPFAAGLPEPRQNVTVFVKKA